MDILGSVKNKVLEFWNTISGRELNKTLRELQSAYTTRTDSLLAANAALTAKLDELVREKQNAEKAESTETQFTEQIASLTAVCEKLETTALSLKTAAETTQTIPHKIIPAVNGLNKMTDEIAALQKTIINTINGNSGIAVEMFEKITAALENNINVTWKGIEETLTKNAKELFETYQRFFEICNTLSKQAATQSAQASHAAKKDGGNG